MRQTFSQTFKIIPTTLLSRCTRSVALLLISTTSIFIMARQEQRERERKRAADLRQTLYRFMSDSLKKSKQDDTCCSELDCGTSSRYSSSFIL